MKQDQENEIGLHLQHSSVCTFQNLSVLNVVLFHFPSPAKKPKTGIVILVLLKVRFLLLLGVQIALCYLKNVIHKQFCIHHMISLICTMKYASVKRCNNITCYIHINYVKNVHSLEDLMFQLKYIYSNVGLFIAMCG